MNALTSAPVLSMDVSTSQRTRYAIRDGAEYQLLNARDERTGFYLEQRVEDGRDLEVHAALAQALALKLTGLQMQPTAMRSVPGGFVFHLQVHT
jgi:hypothetical protein